MLSSPGRTGVAGLAAHLAAVEVTDFGFDLLAVRGRPAGSGSAEANRILACSALLQVSDAAATI